MKDKQGKHSLRLVGGGQGQRRECDPSDQQKERDRRDQERTKQIKKSGGLASKRLESWKVRIKMGDRKQMALNMEGILQRYSIRRSGLRWEEDYKSEDQFGVVLFRSRMSGDSNPGKKLNAHSDVWLRLIDYIHEHLLREGIVVPREYLVDDLTKGTRFHPLKQELGLADKISAYLQKRADQLAVKFDLISSFGLSSRLRAEYILGHGRLIESELWLGGFHPAHFDTTLRELFMSIPSDEELWEKPLNQLSVREWQDLIEALPCKQLFQPVEEMIEAVNSNVVAINDEEEKETIDEYKKLLEITVGYLFDLNRNTETLKLSDKPVVELSERDWKAVAAIKSGNTEDCDTYVCISGFQRQLFRWKGFLDPKKTIAAYANSPGMSLSELSIYPHAFVGTYGYEFPYAPKNRILNPEDSAYRELIVEGLDPVKVRKKIADERFDSDEEGSAQTYDYPYCGWCFIVLLPDLEQCRLVPYLYTNVDGAFCITINEGSLAEQEGIFADLVAPFPAGGPAIQKPLREVILEDHARIDEELESSAARMAENDPYLAWYESKNLSLESLLSDL
jgi:hypothetical protein